MTTLASKMQMFLGALGLLVFQKKKVLLKKKKIEAGELVWPSFMSEDMRSS